MAREILMAAMAFSMSAPSPSFSAGPKVSPSPACPKMEKSITEGRTSMHRPNKKYHSTTSKNQSYVNRRWLESRNAIGLAAQTAGDTFCMTTACTMPSPSQSDSSCSE